MAYVDLDAAQRVLCVGEFVDPEFQQLDRGVDGRFKAWFRTHGLGCLRADDKVFR